VAHFLARVAWNHFLLLKLKSNKKMPVQIALPHDTADKAGEWMSGSGTPSASGVPFEPAGLRYLVGT